MDSHTHACVTVVPGEPAPSERRATSTDAHTHTFFKSHSFVFFLSVFLPCMSEYIKQNWSINFFFLKCLKAFSIYISKSRRCSHVGVHQESGKRECMLWGGERRGGCQAPPPPRLKGYGDGLSRQCEMELYRIRERRRSFTLSREERGA